MNKIWKIPVKHTRYATIEIEAPTLYEAMDKAMDWESMKLIDENQTEEFWELCPDNEEEIREMQDGDKLMWVVVQYDQEQREWNHRRYESKAVAQQGMKAWVKQEIEYASMENELFFRTGEQYEEIIDLRCREVGAVKETTATLFLPAREPMEWYMFHVG